MGRSLSDPQRLARRKENGCYKKYSVRLTGEAINDILKALEAAALRTARHSEQYGPVAECVVACETFREGAVKAGYWSN